MPDYSLSLRDPTGALIVDQYGDSVLHRASRIQLSRTANRIATFEIDLPGTIDKSLVRDDNLVVASRAPDGGVMAVWGVYFIRKRRWTTRGGDEILTISGPDANELLRRRIVAERPGTSDSEYIAEAADDLMKKIVTRAWQDGTNPAPDYGTRVNSAVTVATETTGGPLVSFAIPWEKLLTFGGSGLLPRIAEASRIAGTPVYFAMVPIISTDSISFEFRTYIDHPGADLSDRVTFSLALGNMENPEYIEDSTRAENYIYAFGQGETSDQKVEQAYDESRIAKGPFARIEGAEDASNQPDDAVLSAAQTALASRRPKTSFYADPISTEQTSFGLDWGWGDRVRAQYHGTFDAIVESVTLTVVKGEERLEARLRNVS